MHLGTAFQLIDDVLDYSGDHAQTGKNLGDDLAEGKPTLPLIYAMQHGTPRAGGAGARARSSRAGWRNSQPVLAAIRDTGALDYARAAGEARSATRHAPRSQRLPNSTYRDSLLQLADFAVTAPTDAAVALIRAASRRDRRLYRIGV